MELINVVQYNGIPTWTTHKVHKLLMNKEPPAASDQPSSCGSVGNDNGRTASIIKSAQTQY